MALPHCLEYTKPGFVPGFSYQFSLLLKILFTPDFLYVTFASRILVFWPGMPLAFGAHSLNHWTTRKVPIYLCVCRFFLYIHLSHWGDKKLGEQEEKKKKKVAPSLEIFFPFPHRHKWEPFITSLLRTLAPFHSNFTDQGWGAWIISKVEVKTRLNWHRHFLTIPRHVLFHIF